MNELSSGEFEHWLEAVDRGEALPQDLPAEDAADLALAGRLIGLRAPVSPQLSNRVSTLLASHDSRRRSRSPKVHRLTARQVAWALALLILAFAGTLAISPTARAQVAEFLEGPPVMEEGNVRLAEAQATFPTLRVPRAPVPFELSSDVVLGLPRHDDFPLRGYVRLEWRDALRGQAVWLTVYFPRDAATNPEPIVEDLERRWQPVLPEVQASQVHDWAVWVVEFRGWRVVTQVDELTWVGEGGALYSLVAPRGTVSAEELARMAETAR